MDLFGDILPILLLIISWLVNISLVVFFFSKKTLTEKINFLILVAVIFFIFHVATGSFSDYFYNANWSFALTQMVIVTLLVLTGMKLVLNPITYAVLLAIYVFTLYTPTPWAQIIGVTVYIINSYGFIRGAFELVFPSTKDLAY